MWGKDAVIPMLQAPPLAWGYRQRRAAARRWSRAPPLDNVIEIQKYRTERSELGGSQIQNQSGYVVISHLQRSWRGGGREYHGYGLRPSPFARQSRAVGAAVAEPGAAAIKFRYTTSVHRLRKKCQLCLHSDFRNIGTIGSYWLLQLVGITY